MTKRLVIYHGNCIDGYTSAWAAWLKYGDDAEYLPASYGDPPPDVTGRWVLVVDFSYPRDVMLKMKERASALSVFDHHKTAQAALDGLDFATFDMDRSGAGLTWDLLHRSERPWLISFVEDRDLWRWKLSKSKEVNAWVSACRRERFEDWSKLNNTPLDKVIDKGEAVLSYIDRYVSEMCEQSRVIAFAGYEDIPIVNAPYISISELVGKLAEKAPFAIGWSQRADGLYAYSLRSRGPEGVDVSEIAKRYGGGGHRNSAGFVQPMMLEEQC